MVVRLLDRAYKDLGYNDGVLLDTVIQPRPNSKEAQEWLEKGDWLALGYMVGAEKVLFVQNNPVIVFRNFEDKPDANCLLETFRRSWCMARPQHLFISWPGVLEVYNLNQPPPRKIEDWRPLDVAHTAAEVSKKLGIYRREQIESGRLFADERFGNIDYRADKRLIEDLKAVRKALIDANLKERYAHSLIGRSIFIRYLEDRGVLTPAYFKERVAKKNPIWQSLLAKEPEKPDLTLDLTKRRYDRILLDKDFTYALFDQLANDFNGDMFPKDKEEEAAVSQEHLDLLRGFLLGEYDPLQPKLFFWAYNFEIIPIGLISSIYEEFYHKNNEDDKGTHYTPGVLVDDVLSRILTSERLANNPKILDPACGSGIFLVEAFRRIVRYHIQQQGYKPLPDQLRAILRNQITGVEINEEAVHVAAFSLYLALLHYQEPPDILAQIRSSENSKKPLPNLIFSEGALRDTRHFDILFHKDIFGLMRGERDQLGEKLKISKSFAGRSKVASLYNSPVALPLMPGSFDIIVGNPPWGIKKGATKEIEVAQQRSQKWCEVFGWSLGDKELSQAFIARSLSLLKKGGECGLLVSTGVFLKHHENSRKFRKRWLQEITLKTVVNFTHVRKIFFSAAVAPFTFVHYENNSADPLHRVFYWSAKKSEIVDKTKAVVLTLSDLHQVKQTDLASNEILWKVYWWGSHRDAAFIDALNLNDSLYQISMKRKWSYGQGYTPGHEMSADWLKNYKELPVKIPVNNFRRYGFIKDDELVEVPEKVHRLGIRELYSGWRLLIKRGITEAKGTNGRIESRLDDKTFCFRNSVHALRIDNTEDWERKLLLGILWSSLARYYFFMTASSWGTWHHEIHLEEILNLPVRFPKNKKIISKVVGIVDKLRTVTSGNNDYGLFAINPPETEHKIRELEKQLDAAIFELYGLSDADQELINDTCDINLDFFYNDIKSTAIQKLELFPNYSQGIAENLFDRVDEQKGLEGYLHAFLQVWNRELEPDGEFSWRVIRPAKVPMIAIVFTTREKETPLPDISTADDEEWVRVLKQCAKTSLQPVSRKVYIDGMIRVVSDTDIIIIKRDERRLWTRSHAREDAEATLLQAMRLQEITGGRR